MTTAAVRETRDWGLFADWSRSFGRDPLPTSAELVGEFLAAFPAALETQGRRVRAIRRAHERAGLPLELPGSDSTRAFRTGTRWATVPQALAQVPKYQHRKNMARALRGRRDGWLIVLIGVLGLTREQARSVHQRDVVLFPTLSVLERPVPRAASPDECAACAVTRWLRVAGAASFGWWNDIKDAVSPDGVEETDHDCLTGLDGTWRQAETLLPAVDRHGWVTAVPMSARAISSVTAERQTPGQTAELPRWQPTVATGRFAAASLREVADAYDEVDQRAAAALLRLKEIVGESDEMLDHIKSFAS